MIMCFLAVLYNDVLRLLCNPLKEDAGSSFSKDKNFMQIAIRPRFGLTCIERHSKIDGIDAYFGSSKNYILTYRLVQQQQKKKTLVANNRPRRNKTTINWNALIVVFVFETNDDEMDSKTNVKLCQIFIETEKLFF